MAEFNINDTLLDLVRDVSAIKASTDNLYRELVGQAGRIPRMEEDIRHLQLFESGTRDTIESARAASKTVEAVTAFVKGALKVAGVVAAAFAAVVGTIKLYIILR